MRAIDVVDGALELVEMGDPVPGPGEALVRVAAAGVNRADILQRAGRYPVPDGASPVLGLECSGTIEALGEGATGWHVGDEVAALLDGGGYAELVVVPTGQLLRVPDGVSLVDAAGLPEAVCTVWSNLVHVAHLRPGETLLVQGGSGGVGSMAVQLAAAAGIRVLTTAGGPERCTRCVELGAEAAIDHHREDVAGRVRELTAGRGVDVVLDVLGGGALALNVGLLATGGRLVIIGTQQGLRGELDVIGLMSRRASVHGTTLRARPRTEKAAIVADVCERVWPMFAHGRARPIIHERLPLADAARAHELMDSGAVFGKVLLVP
jgi:putative PIG3 family NAD(P)H quinone oxidoreductase